MVNDKLEKYLNIHLNSNLRMKKNYCQKAQSLPMMDACPATEEISITDYITNNKEEETFQTKLFSYIDKNNLKDSDVYNKVNIDRRLFSKIRSNRDYHPSKETVILLGLALELTETEIEDLLKSASYSLPMNTTYDLIIRFCFKEHIYNINQINDFLYDHDCKTLSV